LNRDDAASAAMALPGRRLLSFGLDKPKTREAFGLAQGWLVEGEAQIMEAAALPIHGAHNVSNALAACALARACGVPRERLAMGLKSFRGLPHRLELVARRQGVDWYDDSKGTNVGATIAALRGLGRKAVLILGGEGKGQDFSPLRAPVAQFASRVLLIGRDAPLIEAAVAGAGVPIRRAPSMDEAVALAAQAARPGDAVLLSPACASFDMFRDYRHRGEVFRLAVERVIGAPKH